MTVHEEAIEAAGSDVLARGSQQSRWGRVGQIQSRFQLLQVAALAALFIWGTASVTDFSSGASIRAMLVSAAFLGFAGAGQTIVILLGGIDFSIPAFIAAGAILICQLCGSDGWSVEAAIALIAGLSLLFGGLNGFISHKFAVPPLVVTLGMSSVITGGLLVWTKGLPTGAPPPFLMHLTAVNSKTFGLSIPPLVAIWAVLAVLLGLALRRTVAGRRLYQTGSNPAAATLTHVNTRLVWTATFALSGALGALVGILLGGYTGSGNTTLGQPYLWEGLAAVIVGGTAFGARGNYWKTVIGALTLTELTTVLVGNGYSNADQQIIFGVVILLVVAGYIREPRFRDRI